MKILKGSKNKIEGCETLVEVDKLDFGHSDYRCVRFC